MTAFGLNVLDEEKNGLVVGKAIVGVALGRLGVVKAGRKNVSVMVGNVIVGIVLASLQSCEST